ncbi:low temperature requirement protein A [Nocardioides sp. YIM 152315]|uniref:low temperature requirement protein A n=1 Tax=Nocardioides sp. YIM 152315 TaxID=3031760 RepID=UPI0023D9DF94|nr:low temperature requirement protein A [Nocardioides sp. YIM 152315]MDF1602031.1 low temperature requirement protein A [Nocardioides sp. YIM 152315]
MRRVMGARAVDEANRTATPLELLFDLTFVAAVAQVAGRLAHATIDGEGRAALGPFLMVFFATWWAWMNFTWFASAYDNDDVTYRLAAFVQMSGVLVLAAGTGLAFDQGEYIAVTSGYVIMRVGLLGLWLRAAYEHPAGRSTSLRYAGGLTVLTALWLARLSLDGHAAVTTFLILATCELLVPIWAERRGPTSWHPHHIAERYSLFTIILLGESVFAATTAVVAVLETSAGPALFAVSASSLVIVFALWWLYFAVPAGAALQAHRRWSFVWGYGHYIPFAALASLGAGLEVAVAASADHAPHLSSQGAVAAVAGPVAVVIIMVELLRMPGESTRVRPASIVAMLALGAIVGTADRLGLVAGIALVAVTAAAAVSAETTSAVRARSWT